MDALQAAFTNEARKQFLRVSIAEQRAIEETAASIIGQISSTATDAFRARQAKERELAGLEAGAGPGVFDDYGLKSDHLAAFIAALEGAGLLTDPVAARTLAGL